MTPSRRRTWLNVGSGVRGTGLQPPGFDPREWQEVRLDANASVHPDVLAPADDLVALEAQSFDAVFSSNCIEHLYLDQAIPALREWRRVLKPEGFLLAICPDLQASAELIAQDRLMDVTSLDSDGEGRHGQEPHPYPNMSAAR